MKISYSILVHNETDSLEKLLDCLVKYKEPQDEIVILDDFSDNKKTKSILDFYVSTQNIVFEQRNLLGDFATQKNYLKNMCSGDYSFNLDADELISHWFMKDIHEILEGNQVDLIYLPRINTVEGLTEEHIRYWRWQVNEKGWINFPDIQDRLFKHNKGIKFHEIPHGRLENKGKKYAILPYEEVYSIIHIKSFEKQTSDNNWHDNKERELGLKK